MLLCTLCLYSNIYFCCIILTGNNLTLPRADSAILFYFTLLCIFLHLYHKKNLNLYHNKHSLIFFTIILLFVFVFNVIFLHVSASIPQNVQNKSVYKIIIARVIQYVNEFKINLN